MILWDKVLSQEKDSEIKIKKRNMLFNLLDQIILISKQKKKIEKKRKAHKTEHHKEIISLLAWRQPCGFTHQTKRKRKEKRKRKRRKYTSEEIRSLLTCLVHFSVFRTSNPFIFA
jgi:hypothetical protein